jgi:hypothetical protein
MYEDSHSYPDGRSILQGIKYFHRVFTSTSPSSLLISANIRDNCVFTRQGYRYGYHGIFIVHENSTLYYFLLFR